MRISDVKTYVLGTAWRNLTYVEVHTDEGLVGVGEVRMLNHTDALIGFFAEAVPNHVLGADPFQVEDLVARMFRNDYARAGEIAMSAISTLEMARQLEPSRPGWVEEPVPPENLAALKKAAEHIRIPVATGERIHTRHEFRELLELQAADVIQPDITHFGGILETKKLAAWADAYYVLVAPHNVGGPVSTAANLHLAACTTNFKIQEHFNDFAEEFVKAAAPGNPEVVDGYFALPQGPGLGVTLDEALVAEHPRAQVQFNLFAEDWQYRQARTE